MCAEHTMLEACHRPNKYTKTQFTEQTHKQTTQTHNMFNLSESKFKERGLRDKNTERFVSEKQKGTKKCNSKKTYAQKHLHSWKFASNYCKVSLIVQCNITIFVNVDTYIINALYFR